jgi:Glutamate racemase
LLQGYVDPLLAAGVDTIILGCTHYPFLKPLLKQMLPQSISLIDTGAAVARQLQRLLAERELLAEGPARPAQFWSSADPAHFRNILPILWNMSGVVRSFEG